ncbi:hypothetical protein BX600DRAFT_464894 [Xylariales sp. PMI_506]|nr:hypothetical protein BX600DRAFT_464894 [Xylariales sp. PMI_506]
MHSQSFLAGLGFMASAVVALDPVQLFNFSITIENSALRPNGKLLLSTFTNASLFTLDPSSEAPIAELVDELPGATAICAIATIGYDKYAIVGGIRGNYNYTNETIFTVDYSGNLSTPIIEIAATAPNATMLNGMTSLSEDAPHILLAGDSRQGALYRIDLDAGTPAELVFQDEQLTAPENASVPLGINGLKTRDGYVYFTNSERYTFGRIPVNADGTEFGAIEIVSYLNTTSVGYDWDDFIFDTAGVAYLAQPPNAIARILPDGTQTLFAGGGDDYTMKRPTSLDVAADGATLYITTGGTTVDGITYGGQVLELAL